MSVRNPGLVAVESLNLADAMAALFQQLEPYACGRGRVALAVFHFGGAAMCRSMLEAHCDHKERWWRIQYVMNNAKGWDECDVLLGFK